MKKISLFLFSLLFVLPLFSQSLTWKPKLDSLMDYLASHHRFSGSLTMEKAGNQIYSYTHNEMDRGTGRYRIGSVSKVLTAIIVFQLVEEGKLSLKDTIARWFPTIPNSAQIRVGNLLSHTSGIYDITHAADFYASRTQPHTRQMILDKIVGHKPYAKPDEEVFYSNSNFILLGYIIEDLTGKPYAANLAERIVQPLYLQDTYCEVQASEKSQREESYRYNGEKWIADANSDPSLPGAAGAVVSTPAELCRIFQALFEGELLQPESLAGMQSLRNKSMGHGIFKAPFYDHDGWGHTGRIDEFRTGINYYPADSLAIGFTSNGINMSMNEIMLAALSIYFGREFVYPTFPKTDIVEPPVSVFEGDYKVKLLVFTIAKLRIGPAGANHLFMGPIENYDQNPNLLMERRSALGFWVRENGGEVIFGEAKKGNYKRARLVQGKMSMRVKRMRKQKQAG